jgi:hypothetical protein
MQEEAAMKGKAGILLTAIVLCLAAAPAAQAAFLMDPQIDFATDPIAVGSSGTGTLSFSNNSGAGEDADSIERIVLEPSCRLPGDTPPCDNRDPGVFSITNVTGVTGTSCQNLTFTVGLGTAPFGGSLEFTPTGGLGTIPNMPVSAECVIRFTYTALAVPTFDSQPGEDGVQTDQLSFVRAEHNGGGATGFGPGTGDTTVTPAPPVTTPVPTPTPTPPATAAPVKKKCKKKPKKAAAAAKKCKTKKKK